MDNQIIDLLQQSFFSFEYTEAKEWITNSCSVSLSFAGAALELSPFYLLSQHSLEGPTSEHSLWKEMDTVHSEAPIKGGPNFIQFWDS